jgi:hypothetical protein
MLDSRPTCLLRRELLLDYFIPAGTVGGVMCNVLPCRGYTKFSRFCVVAAGASQKKEQASPRSLVSAPLCLSSLSGCLSSYSIGRMQKRMHADDGTDVHTAYCKFTLYVLITKISVHTPKNGRVFPFYPDIYCTGTGFSGITVSSGVYFPGK